LFEASRVIFQRAAQKEAMSRRSPSPSSQVDDLPEEDVLADDVVEEDEGEGEDLHGQNMLDDYAEDPELDVYDPAMLDDSGDHTLTLEQRQAAERAMSLRDRKRGRSPSASLAASPGPTDSDIGTPDRSIRRRIAQDGSPDVSQATDDIDDADDEVSTESYDLTREQLGEGNAIDKRLKLKIQKCFQQFLRRFRSKGKPNEDDVDSYTEPVYPEEIKKMAEEHSKHLDVNFKHLQDWSGTLAFWIAEHPFSILPILDETLMTEVRHKFETYNQMNVVGLRVAIFDFFVEDPIRELCTNHLNKLVKVRGVVTKRSGVFNQVKRLYLRCAKCSFPSGPFDVEDDKDLKPSACIECQSRGPWRVDRQKTLYRNHQKITLQESPGSVEAGKMPRSKEVVLTDDQVDQVRPGDELIVTGMYRCLHDAGTNARTCFPVYRTIIDAVHIHRKGDVKIEHVTDEEQERILELAKNPNIREMFIESMAPSIYGMRHVKTAIALSMMGGMQKTAAGKHRIRGDINCLVVGDPGLAKSQFLKYVEKTFPRAVYTTGKGASAVGLTAAVQRDETGQFCLQGGAMVLADDGICLIDEFDKMNDQDRTSIHEAMEQQTISVSKAGIVATLQARCAVIAVANPIEGRYDATRTFAQNVNLTDPILSRFDILCVIRDESDSLQDERLADHVLCSHTRSHPCVTAKEKLVKPKIQQRKSHVEPIDQDLLQKYIIYARQRIKPQVSDIDKDKLANFYKDIRAEAFRGGGAPMTARHIESIIRLAEASAKIELRQHVTGRDLDFAISMMLESFIQSQKHQIAEELRKTFRRYITQSMPLSEQFMALLEKLFREKAEDLRLQGADEEPAVSMTDVVSRIERQDLDMNEATAFMRSEKFRQNFRLDGEMLYQIV